MTSRILPSPDGWECPRCGYSLAGLPPAAVARCPECARETSALEQAAIARARGMSRHLRTIARAGIAANLLIVGWCVVGVLDSIRTGDAHLVKFAIALLIASIGLVPSIMAWRRLERLHAQHEVLAWVAAHITWVPTILCLAILR